MLYGYATRSHASAHAGKTIWSCLSPRWRLVFLSAQCSNVCCLANNRTHSCLSGSFNTRAVNQIGKRTRGTNLVGEKGPIERRRLLSRLGSVYILFWCKITENADRCSYSGIISHQVTLTMSSHMFLYLLLHSPKNLLTHRKVKSHCEKTPIYSARKDDKILSLWSGCLTTYCTCHQINAWQ